MKKLALLLLPMLLLLLWTPPLFARDYTGTGICPTRSEARKEALADLSQAIHVEVVSEFSSVVTQTATTTDALNTKHLDISSRLPLFGVTLSVAPSGSEFKATAHLSPEALPLYTKELPVVRRKIAKALAKTDNARTHAEKIALLQEALTRLDRFQRLSLVARLLGGTVSAPPDITEGEIKTRIGQLEKKADSLDEGLKRMAKHFTEKGIYIFPPTTGSSREITPFASAVKDHLAVYVNTSASPASAACTLTGEYTVLDGGVELTCRLMDREQNTLRTAMAWFLPGATQGYRTQPETLDFEKLIASGMVVSSDFAVDIKTADGRSDLLYKPGETITLLIKMNRPGYFYLMSHAFKGAPYTYLVELSDAPGNRKFVSYIGPDEAGKWVTLGDFEAVPPFGVETVQVYAATRDLEERVPHTFPDPATDLYKVGSPEKEGSRPSEAVVTTRGLMRKKNKGSAQAEASLTITTLAR